MPHHTDDARNPHLPLVREEPNPPRRRQTPPPPQRPDRGGRQAFGTELATRLGEIEQEAQARPAPAPGIQPHLVFRVPLAPRTSISGLAERLRAVGLTVVAVEPDGAVIAFRDDADLAGFRRAVAEYIQGPRINPTTQQPYASTSWDAFESIEVGQMRLWGRVDRAGRRLRDLIGEGADRIEPARLYALDVELWHRGTRALAQASLEELRRLVTDRATPQERFCDHFVGDSLCLARVRVTGAKLDRLVGMDAVAEVDLPAAPVFDWMMAHRARPGDFPTPPRPAPDGPSVCVLDSGITPLHPLLASNVGHYEAFLTGVTSGADEVGHGTLVAGVAVFGDVRAGYESGAFASDVTVFSARITSPDSQFDDERLVVNQIGDAIRFYKAAPYNCRIFNLSLGENAAWLHTNSRQSVWAESLDTLARDEEVLIVVSAGNQDLGHARNAREAEAALAEYPHYLFEPECGLNSPATAAIAVTVGGIVDREEIAVRRGSGEDDLVRPVAQTGHPSPITRIGPGLNDAVKPEFVAPAGNQLFQGFGPSHRQIGDDHGLSVMSFSHEPTKTLFAYGVGTSYAAPRVAGIAARVWHRLRGDLGEEPHPNLVRAVLATAADVPQPLSDLVSPDWGEEGVRRVCGYGAIDEELALDSGDRRLTLIAQGRIEIDSFLIYALPVPDEFRGTGGEKRVVVALAFDPPVRRRRAEYLGVDMSACLIRGRGVDEIVAAYRAYSSQEKAAARSSGGSIPLALKPPYRCDLQPGPTALKTSTLQRSEWVFRQSADCYGDTYYVVVRAERNWAPEAVTHQNFGLAVSMVTSTETQLYALVRQRIAQRVRLRQRV
ncbi:MAG: S8 family peptidase [Gemmataceae bacterium]